MCCEEGVVSATGRRVRWRWGGVRELREGNKRRAMWDCVIVQELCRNYDIL